MKTFKDVYINTESKNILSYIDAITRELVSPWERAYKNEDSTISMGETAFCFQRNGDSLLPAAGLCIFQKDNTDTWYIPNVVPLEFKAS